MSTGPTEPDLTLGPEWAALELLCIGQARERPEQLLKLLSLPELHLRQLKLIESARLQAEQAAEAAAAAAASPAASGAAAALSRPP